MHYNRFSSIHGFGDITEDTDFPDCLHRIGLCWNSTLSTEVVYPNFLQNGTSLHWGHLADRKYTEILVVFSFQCHHIVIIVCLHFWWNVVDYYEQIQILRLNKSDIGNIPNE